MKRTKLSHRTLPVYSRGEEIMNMVTHIVGGGIGAIGLPVCVIRAAENNNLYGLISSIIFCTSMICLYTFSSVYHGLRPGTAKKVLQVIDHCTIYFLIAGSYTPIALSALRPVYPTLGWGMAIFQWVLCALCISLTAIDLKKFRTFSMICYIGMGWAVLPLLQQTIEVLTMDGFLFLLFGGIAYTIGAIFYGIGSKKKWFHSIFHIFVVVGSLLQLIAIAFYAL